MNRNIINQITIAIILIFAFATINSPRIIATYAVLEADGGEAGGTGETVEEPIDTAEYKTGLKYDEGEYLFKKAGKVLTILRAISIMVAVICLSIIGIKYMLGSIDEKANYKEKLLPVAIGCILIAGLNSLLLAINSIMNS